MLLSENKATLIGATAVLLWGALALFTTWSGDIPPFQLVAMTFSIAFLLAVIKWMVKGEGITKYLKQPVKVWIMGIGGLFGYHFFYFMALKNAPAVEASLIAYMWPLLIVVFSSFLPDEKLAIHHIIGTLLGLSGCVIIITDGGGNIAFNDDYITGYIAAVACALTWSIYSVLSRKNAKISTDVVGWFCGATAILGLVCHLIFEQTYMPETTLIWVAVLLLGLGPVGLAFFAWDVGVKIGNIKALGAFSYMAPLLSAVLLVIFGDTKASFSLLLACLAITGGALLAAKDMFIKKKNR